MSLDVIRQIECCSQMLPARSIAALDTLRINKIAHACVMQLRKSDSELNDTIQVRSNNSFNASGMSAAVIRKIGCLVRCFPPR